MSRFSIVISLILLLAIPTAIAVSAASNDSENDMSTDSENDMLSLLKPGQRVKLETAGSGGFNINVLTEQYIESYERADGNFIPPTITTVRRDYVIVGHSLKTDTFTQEFRQAIAADAIHVITLLEDQIPIAGR